MWTPRMTLGAKSGSSDHAWSKRGLERDTITIARPMQKSNPEKGKMDAKRMLPTCRFASLSLLHGLRVSRKKKALVQKKWMLSRRNRRKRTEKQHNGLNNRKNRKRIIIELSHFLRRDSSIRFDVFSYLPELSGSFFFSEYAPFFLVSTSPFFCLFA